MSLPAWPEDLLGRMERAIVRVRERLLLATGAFERAGVPYAVSGSCAVACWIARVDASAVRNAQEILIVVRRGDFAAARHSLDGAGFADRPGLPGHLFLESPDAHPRHAVRLLRAGERFSEEAPFPIPDVEPAAFLDGFRALPLEPLVAMLLTTFRRTDMVDLRDLIGVGLVDASWLDRLPAPLDDRLRELLDDPEG